MTTIAIARAARAARRGTRSRYGRTVTSAVMVVLLLGFLVLLVHPGLFAHTSPLDNGDDSMVPPSAAHLFGTDQLGRDVYSRVIFGAQPVLTASLGGVLLATLAGVAIGLIAGMAPRAINIVVMRIVDVLLALPVLLIALILIATIGSGVKSIILALGVAYTPGFARIVEASVRKLRSIEYVQAAKMFGSSGVRTAVRHLLPNLVTEVVVMVSSAVGWAVLTATTLSFLGLGVQLPNPDWGSDLAAGATSLSTAWWLSTFPGIAITVTILVANFAGDWVMTLIDPSGRRARTRFRPFGGLRTSLPSAEPESGPEPELGPEPVTAPGRSTAPEEKA
jgi:ABC-type dipeptide/oligopeptide/nickel transport system permease subunit